MLRDAFNERLKAALRARDGVTVRTVRLVLAALKDRDIAQRGTAHPEPLADPDILRLLQGMIKQRREAIELYEKGGRPELAAQEAAEIAAAAKAAIAESGAAGVKDMGKVMAILRQRHAGVIDLARAGPVVRALLG